MVVGNTARLLSFSQDESQCPIWFGAMTVHDLGRDLASLPRSVSSLGIEIRTVRIFQADARASSMRRTAWLASWALEHQRDDRRPCVRKVEPACPFRKTDTPVVAVPSEIPRQVVPPPVYLGTQEGYAGGLRGSMPPPWCGSVGGLPKLGLLVPATHER